MLCHQSILDASVGDGVIFGASSVSHVRTPPALPAIPALFSGTTVALPPRSLPGCNSCTTDSNLISRWQAEHNVAAYGDGPLPDTIVDAMDAAWDVARVETESYFRGYGEEPGGIELVLAKPQARI